MISDSHSPYYSPVAWSVGYYTVEGGKKIYGLICAPTTGGPYPVVIYNHGGTDNTNGGSITGVVTASGWTAQPPGAPDGLGQCLDWAKRGWVFATSSYRGEAVTITSSSPQFPSSTWTSDGNVEFCMGEADVIRHYFAARGDLSIQKFETMPILILHGDVDTGNPVPLDQAAAISADIGATNIFVGPTGVSPPSSQPCIDGPVGAPLPPTLTAPNKSCPISFTLMNTGDPCVNGSTPPLELGLCKVLLLPLAPPPPPGQPQQLHYLVVYHNMNHTNGGLAIKETFNRFAEQNFDRQPGCDGLQINCAAD